MKTSNTLSVQTAIAAQSEIAVANANMQDAIRNNLANIDAEGMNDATALWRIYGERDEDRVKNFLKTQQASRCVSELEKGRSLPFRISKGRYGKTLMHPDLQIEYLRWLDSNFAIQHNRLGHNVATGVVKIEPVMPTNMLETARAWLLALEENENLKQQMLEREKEFNRTKAQISDKREASAMSRAGVLARQVNKLEHELAIVKDASTEYATIKAVAAITGTKYGYAPLRKLCNMHEMEMRDVPDETYGTVKSYPWEAWISVHNVDIRQLLSSK